MEFNLKSSLYAYNYGTYVYTNCLCVLIQLHVNQEWTIHMYIVYVCVFHEGS